MSDKINYRFGNDKTNLMGLGFDIERYFPHKKFPQPVQQSSIPTQQPTAVAELRDFEELFLLRRRFRQGGVVIK